MANSKERINALEAQMADMFKSDHHAPGVLKQFSLRLDALEENLESTDNARHAESMDWESKFQDLQDQVELLIDRLFFFFMEGLKPWARTELNRRQVNNLNEAISAAESLSDYNLEPQRPPQRVNPSRTNGDKKPGSQAPNQSWGGQPPTDERPDTQDYEEEDVVGAFPQWCNAVTMQVGNPEEDLSGEKPKDMKRRTRERLDVNGKAIRAMVDTGATHNYISSTRVERLGLTLEKGCGQKGLKRDETTYLAMLQWDIIEELSGPLPREVKVILNDFEDVMPDELPKKLPPRRAIDHEIELVPGPPKLPIECHNLNLPNLENS
ncbi:hypothetical protein RJ640_012304 [Escallonia rubra]|uniref:Uncharacterized protein n=1 Tax=Escallonia rubra TaxID=112253 RepID=A0AA88R9H2_9ASTE|nr:hypothetical protein RJ640_012304 [Escallonia rubra]